MSSLHARPTLLPLLLSAGVLTACSDRSPVAPEVPAPVPAAVQSSTLGMEVSGADGADDILDLLERVLPAIDDRPATNALAVHLRRMMERIEVRASSDVSREASAALSLLDAVERADKGQSLADLGVIRLVLENRL